MSPPLPTVLFMPTTAFAEPSQPTFDDLGRHLSQVTFCVVDLETTGGGVVDTITEFGAVKVRGGEVLGEFQTLVNPLTHIPPLIAVLTGITDQLVADAPVLAEVLPTFLEFAGDSVLVAHNAAFDVGFLKRACVTHGYPWHSPDVIDTVALARQALLRDEVPNFKLSTLAHHLGAHTTPNHRALADAQATVDVLHALIERLGNLGVATLEDLQEFMRRVSPQRRAKRTWAADLPQARGVYSFVADLPDARGQVRRQVLYVGKSRNIRSRVRTYFTAAETRPRMDEMVRIATGVEATVCRTDLEADILELRLIAAHAPRYNRRSKFPERQVWVKLTREAFPRLSIVRMVADDDAQYFGPFRRRAAAEQVMSALWDTFPLRQCTTRLSTRRASPSCALAGMGRCCAPCELAITPAQYAGIAEQVRAAMALDVRPVLSAAGRRLGRLIPDERFEEAAAVTSRVEAFTRAALRHHRLASLAGCPQIVAGYRTDQGWEIHVIRHGRLAGAALSRQGEVPQAVARAAVATADSVARPTGPAPAGIIEETERIADWLERPGIRLIDIEGTWSWPLNIGLAAGELARHALSDEARVRMPP